MRKLRMALWSSCFWECRTWEDLCKRYAFADPAQFATNTTTMTLFSKLCDMREAGLIDFTDQFANGDRRPVGEIKEIPLSSKVRLSFGGMSLSDAVMLSRHAKGVAVAPVFERPNTPDERTDIFVIMPFNRIIENVYTNHIKRIGAQLGLTIRRADDVKYSPEPFMKKVWDGICAAQLVIADCTQKNPNVFYEIGITHTVGKKVVLITRSEKGIPSDIRNYEYIQYAYDPQGTDQFIQKLTKFIKAHFLIS
jgi:hypothetical protein